MPKAKRDLKKVPRKDICNIVKKIKDLSDGLKGDVKKLTNFTPEYRLRCGDWRILFEIEENRIVIYRIMMRKDVYRLGG